MLRDLPRLARIIRLPGRPGETTVVADSHFTGPWLSTNGERDRHLIGEKRTAVDRYPKLLKHSDFHRLRYFAVKQRKQAYVELLSAMQKRWPDPKDVHWKLGKDGALESLCTLFKTDRRGTSFYQWLRGKRGIGDLP